MSRHKFEISVAIDKEQVNSTIGQYGMAGNGPNTPNLPISLEVRADSGTSGLELDVGSVALVQYGPATQFGRGKALTRQASISQVGDFEPMFAFRVEPGREDVNVQTLVTELLDYGTTDLFEVFFQSFAASKVGFSGNDSWGTPPEWSATNNVMEFRNDPNSIPASDGTTSSTVADIGGFQLGHGVTKGGKSNDPRTQAPEGEVSKANLTEDRIGVVCGKVVSGGSTGEATVYHSFDQKW